MGRGFQGEDTVCAKAQTKSEPASLKGKVGKQKTPPVFLFLVFVLFLATFMHLHFFWGSRGPARNLNKD